MIGTTNRLANGDRCVHPYNRLITSNRTRLTNEATTSGRTALERSISFENACFRTGDSPQLSRTRSNPLMKRSYEYAPESIRSRQAAWVISLRASFDRNRAITSSKFEKSFFSEM
ncbi:hypothetical protein IH601_02095 [Candidatus Bipolaricaulota bacterium]|nr:hypothetical protein [Candidatus Bipolaricaulota bacterium]TFH09997.1 MAG: hypothetical protein E4H08_04565 [Candidatus Atribacteria bacterium]